MNDRRMTDKKFTQTEFLKAVGLSLTGLNNILDNGAMPKISTLWEIAIYFEKDMNYFFDLESVSLVDKSKDNLIDTNSLFVRRFEELVIQNNELKRQVEQYELMVQKENDNDLDHQENNKKKSQ